MKATAVVGLVKTLKRLNLIDSEHYQQIIAELLFEVIKGRKYDNKKENNQEKK